MTILTAIDRGTRLFLVYNMPTAIPHVAMFKMHQTKDNIHHYIRCRGQTSMASNKAKLLLVMDLLTFTVAMYWDSLFSVSLFRLVDIKLLTRAVLNLQRRFRWVFMK